MACPDEDTYARFVQGLLAPERTAELERHIDGCRSCTRLAAEFGRVYGANPSPGPAHAQPHAARLAVVAGVMAAVHLAAIAVAPLTAFRAWMAVGAGMAVIAAVGLGLGRRWGRGAARLHALVALPSIVLTPLAAYQLWELRRR